MRDGFDGIKGYLLKFSSVTYKGEIFYVRRSKIQIDSNYVYE